MKLTSWDESKLPTLSFNLEFRSMHFYRCKSIYIGVRIMKIRFENKKRKKERDFHYFIFTALKNAGRLICGDPDLVAAVQHDAIDDWRGNSRERLPELRRSLADRHLRAGDLAYLLEPDLKEARGGLRDINALRAISRSGAASISLEHISTAESVLNNAREALHTVTNRDKDRLLFQEQDKVAELLKYQLS